MGRVLESVGGALLDAPDLDGIDGRPGLDGRIDMYAQSLYKSKQHSRFESREASRRMSTALLATTIHLIQLLLNARALSELGALGALSLATDCRGSAS